jgi:hypothetical protein
MREQIVVLKEDADRPICRGKTSDVGPVPTYLSGLGRQETRNGRKAAWTCPTLRVRSGAETAARSEDDIRGQAGVRPAA